MEARKEGRKRGRKENLFRDEKHEYYWLIRKNQKIDLVWDLDLHVSSMEYYDQFSTQY